MPYSDIINLQKELAEYRQEYENLLNDARVEVPELETLVRINPVQCDQLQKKLRPNEAVLYFTVLDDRVLTWLIMKDDLQYESFPYSRIEFNRNADRLFNSMREGTTDAGARQEISALLTVLDSARTAVRDLVIVPPNELLLLPWSAILRSSEKPYEMNIVLSTSLTDYYYSFDKRRIQGQRIYFASRDMSSDLLKDIGYTVVLPLASQEENSFPAQSQPLGRSDVIYLNVEGEWNEIDPARSRMGYRIRQSSLAVFSSIDLYRLTLNANLVQIGFNHEIPYREFNQPFIAWERAFGYAGVPSLLMSLWPVPEPDQLYFMSVFYGYLKDYPAAGALSLTRDQLIREGKSSKLWAGYQLYGFGGMSRQEEEQYALEGFEGQVRRGHSAFDMGEWEDAIRLYESALTMALRQNDSESAALLRQRILESAVNGGFWTKAIETQLAQIEIAKETKNVVAEANGYSNLAFFYTQNNEYENGVQAKALFTRLAEQYGLKEEEAKSLRETGLIYERGGHYDLAVSMFGEALEKFRAIENKQGEASACATSAVSISFTWIIITTPWSSSGRRWRYSGGSAPPRILSMLCTISATPMKKWQTINAPWHTSRRRCWPLNAWAMSALSVCRGNTWLTSTGKWAVFRTPWLNKTRPLRFLKALATASSSRWPMPPAG